MDIYEIKHTAALNHRLLKWGLFIVAV